MLKKFFFCKIVSSLLFEATQPFQKKLWQEVQHPWIALFLIFCTILWSESFGPKSLYKISIVVLLLFSQKIIRSASVVWILDGAFTKHFVYYDISLFGRKFKLFSSFITFFTLKLISSLITHIILTQADVSHVLTW